LLTDEGNLGVAENPLLAPALASAETNLGFREDAATAVPPIAAAPTTAVPKKPLLESFKLLSCPLSLVITESLPGALIKNVHDSQL
jgi:hypothetical protein